MLNVKSMLLQSSKINASYFDILLFYAITLIIFKCAK